MLAALVLAGAPGPACAQTVEELKQLLKERDAEISGLRRRLSDALEGKSAPQAMPPAGETGAGASKITADEDATNRALERVLVQQGGLVLPARAVELQPEFSYANWNKSSGTLQRALYGPALSLRAGLPYESQVQLRVPYLRSETALGNASGVGDIDLALTKELALEKNGWPALLASVGYTSRTGQDALSGQIPIGSGFNSLGGGLTAVKRLDPLVLVAGVSYSVPFARQVAGTEIAPGRSLGLRMGGILAASPETSISLGLNLSSAAATRIGGVDVPDSDMVFGTLQIGLGTLLTRRMLLNVTGDFRVTGNVPNFRLSFSLPTRF